MNRVAFKRVQNNGELKTGGVGVVIVSPNWQGSRLLSGLLEKCITYQQGNPETASNEASSDQWPAGDDPQSLDDGLQTICDELLQSVGATWYTPETFSLEKLTDQDFNVWHRRIRTILDRLGATTPLLIDDARLCILLPVFLSQMQSPVTIHVHCDPIDTAKLLSDRSQISIHHGIALWEYHNLTAFAATRGLPRVLVSHGDLIVNPVATLTKLSTDLNSLGYEWIRRPLDEELITYTNCFPHKASCGSTSLTNILNYKQFKLLKLCESRRVLRRKVLPKLSEGAQIALREIDKNAVEESHIERNRLRVLETKFSILAAEKHSFRMSSLSANQQLKMDEDKFQIEIENLQANNVRLSLQINRLKSSASWRITAPFRFSRRFIYTSKLVLDSLVRLGPSRFALGVKRAVYGPDQDTRLAFSSDHAIAQAGINPRIHWAFADDRKAPGEKTTQKTPSNYDHSIPVAPRRPDQNQLTLEQTIKLDLKSPLSDRPIHEGSQSKVDTASGQFNVDVIVCVHNALDDTRVCLNSIMRHTPQFNKLIIVNDGSNTSTSRYLRYFTDITSKAILQESSEATGYTKACNRGMRASDAEFVVNLNSDTIVTNGWLERLVQAARSQPEFGILGPVSNAASWQSTPLVTDPKGGWSVNPLPDELTPENMSQAMALFGSPEPIEVPLLNGFCLLIRREVITKIGYLDDVTFPRGYGEENDYCFRAIDAGFKLGVVTSCYVFHAKSKSYTAKLRKALTKQSNIALIKKHGTYRVNAATAQFKSNETLATIRRRTATLFEHWQNLKTNKGRFADKILFVLPVRSGGGGVHSVMQEIIGLRRIGVDARLAIRTVAQPYFEKEYEFEISPQEYLVPFKSPKDLPELSADFDVVVATIFFSVDYVNSVITANPHILAAYYIQDYEPYFFPHDQLEYKRAMRSYDVLPTDALYFAKTNYLRKIVEKLHNRSVHKVIPSLDSKIYYQEKNELRNPNSQPVRITAMIRMSTPRRAPIRTTRVLHAIKKKYGQDVEIHVFGTTQVVMTDALGGATKDFVVHGVIKREQVGNLLRKSDIFVDLSDYQAFGRTALEAMRCGCVSIVPQNGGGDEYLIDGYNGLQLDSLIEKDAFAALARLIEDESLLHQLAQKGLETTLDYNIHNAAVSEYILIKSALICREEDDAGGYTSRAHLIASR